MISKALARTKLLLTDRQFWVYSIIGGSGALLDLILYIFLYRYADIPPVFASFLSVSAGILNNFILNYKFNFKTEGHFWSRFIRFYSIGIGGAVLSALLILILFNGIGIDATIAKLLTIPPVVLLQFILNKQITFQEDHKPFQALTRKNLLIIGILAFCYLLFIGHATYLGFQDEYDNILGGWLISHEGQVVYRDFFSHHMPLTYYVGAAITWVTDNNVNLFRLLFVNGLFLWLLWIYRVARRSVGRKFALSLILLISATSTAVLGHLLLAETLIAYACLHALLLIAFDLYKTKRTARTSDIITIAVLGMVPVLCSVSYALISILIYATFAFCFLRYTDKEKWRTKGTLAVVLFALPYTILGGYMAATNSLKAAYRDAVVFNTDYYSQFTNSAGSDVLSTYVNQAYTVLSSTASALHLTSSGSSPTITITISIVTVILLCCVLTLRKEYFILLWFGLAFILSAVRGSITTDPYTQGTHRAAIYVFLVCFATAYLIKIGLDKKMISPKRDPIATTSPLAIAGVAGFIVACITYFFLFLNGTLYLVGVSKAAESIETGIASPPSGGITAQVINDVNQHDGTYWIGPWDFYTQMYVKSERATRYTFFLPWHNVCGSCTAEFLSDLSAEKPRVIYWQHDLDMLGHNTDSYNQPLFSYLADNYVSFDEQNEQLRGFYFRAEDQENIERRLVEKGYLNE